MAAFTTAANGNWNQGATWGNAGNVQGVDYPGPGDTATINHAVTVTANQTVGTSPVAGTDVVTVNGTAGSLTIAAGIILKVRGDLALANAVLTLNAGAGYRFDSTAAGSPGTTNYRIKIGTAHNQNSSKVVANGTVGNICTITYEAGGAPGYFDAGGFIEGGKLTLTYTDLTDVYNPSGNRMIQNNLDIRTNTGPPELRFINCIFNGCGSFYVGTFSSTAGNVEFRDSTWLNSRDTFVYRWIQTGTPTGTRSCTGCVFDKEVQHHEPNGWTFYDCQFWAKWTGSLGGGTITQFERILAYQNVDTSSIIGNFPNGTAKDYYMLAGAGIPASPHGLSQANNAAVISDGGIFEYLGTDDNGEMLLTGGAGGSFTALNNLVLPNADASGDKSSGQLFANLGGSGLTVRAYHNTVHSSRLGTTFGENYAGHLDMCPEWRDNTYWARAVQGVHTNGNQMLTYVETGHVGVRTTDVVQSGNIHHNNLFNLQTGTCTLNGSNQTVTGHHNFVFSSASLPNSVGGLAVNPQFVDDSRDIAKWDASLGGPGTAANAMAELKKRNNRSGYNPAYSVAGLVNYVKAGFVPRNSKLRTASDAGQGSWIGAAQGVPMVNSLRLSRRRR
ncbi:hypothetical protein [Candidatus Nitrospira bockiana]